MKFISDADMEAMEKKSPKKFISDEEMSAPKSFLSDAEMDGINTTVGQDIQIGLEDLGHTLATAGQMVGGGVLNQLGAQETGDKIFAAMDKRRREREEYKKTLNQGLGGQVISGLTGVAPLLAAAPFGAAAALGAAGGMAGAGALESGATNIEKGMDSSKAVPMAVFEGAVDTAANALPIGRGIMKGAAWGAGGNVASQGAKDVVGTAIAETPEQAEQYTPSKEKYIVAAATGAVPGAAFGHIQNKAETHQETVQKAIDDSNHPVEEKLIGKVLQQIDGEIKHNDDIIKSIHESGSIGKQEVDDIAFLGQRIEKLLQRKAELLADSPAPEAIEAKRKQLADELDAGRKAAFEAGNPVQDSFPKQEPITKVTPDDVATTKISEAANESPEQIQERLTSAQEKLDTLPDDGSKSAMVEALSNEIDGYNKLLGKEDTSSVESVEPAKVAPEKAVTEEIDYDFLSQQQAAAEHAGIMENKFSGIPPSKRQVQMFNSLEGAKRFAEYKVNSLSKALESIVQKINDYESGLTPAGTVDIAELYKRRQNLEIVIDKYQRDLTSTKEKLAKPFEEEKPGEVEEITIPEIKETFDSTQTIMDAYPDNVHSAVDAFTDNPQLFNKAGDTNGYFDARFQDTPFGKTAQKVLSHFLVVTGLSKDKIYIVMNDDLPSLGRANYSGNTGVIQLNFGKMLKSTDKIAQWKSVSTLGMVGKNLDNALQAMMLVRVGAHEMGHLLLTRYLQNYVTNIDMFNKLCFDFDTFKQSNKLYNASIFDLRSKGSSQFYKANQQRFHEFFAEEVAKKLLYQHTLGAFSKGVSKSFQSLIDVSVKTLENAGMKVDRKTFASELVDEIISNNKAEIESTGKTLWEKLDRQRNDELLQGLGTKNLFANNTLEDVLNYSANNGMMDRGDPLLGLDLGDGENISTRLASALGSGRATIARKFFGKERLAEFNEKEPAVHKSMWAIRDAEEYSAALVNRLWNGEIKTKEMLGLMSLNKQKNADSPFAVMSTATNADMVTLLNLFQKGFNEKISYEDNLRKNGQNLTDQQTKYYNTLSQLFRDMYKESVDVQKGLGKKNELPFREGWFPSVRAGRYSVTIGYGDIVAHRQHFQTKLQAEKFREKVLNTKMQRMDVSDVLDSRTDAGQTNSWMAEAVIDALDRAGMPQSKEVIQRMLDRINDRGGKLGKHHEYRADIGGYKGDEFFKSQDELGKSFKEAIEQSVTEKGNQVKNLMINDAINPILDNVDFKKQNPQAHAVIQQMRDSAMGRNKSALGDFSDVIDHNFNNVVDTMAKVLGKEYTSDKNALRSTHEAIKTMFYFTKMIPSIAFSVVGQYLNVLPGTVSRASYGGHGFMAYKSFGKGMLNLFRGDATLWDAIKEDSQKYNSFTASFIESMDMNKGNNKPFNFFKDWILMQAPARASDTMSRIMSYAIMYTHYKDLGYNESSARRQARFEADAIMNLYDSANSAPIFDHAGIAGDMIKPLQGFGQNMLGNLFRSIQYMTVKDWRSAGPFINYVLLQTAMAGVLSLPFVQEYEMIRKWLAEKFDDVTLPSILDIVGSDDSIINRTIPLTLNQRQMLYLGITNVSGGLDDPNGGGIDWGKSARANQTFFTILAGLFGSENFMKAMPMVDWATSLPSDIYTASKYMAGHGSVAEGKKAFENVLPVGALGYMAKEKMGLNTTKIMGDNTNMIAVGKEGLADRERTRADKIAGLFGTKSTDQRWEDQITMENAAAKKKLGNQKDRAAQLFTESGDPKYIERMVELGMDSNAIKEKLGTEIWNRSVDQMTRAIINKKGQMSKDSATRAAPRIFGFGQHE